MLSRTVMLSIVKMGDIRETLRMIQWDYRMHAGEQNNSAFNFYKTTALSLSRVH